MAASRMLCQTCAPSQGSHSQTPRSTHPVSSPGCSAYPQPCLCAQPQWHGTAQHCHQTHLSQLRSLWFSWSRAWQLSAPSLPCGKSEPLTAEHQHQNRSPERIYSPSLPAPSAQPQGPKMVLLWGVQTQPTGKENLKKKKVEKQAPHEGVSSLQPAPGRGIPPCYRPWSATKHLRPIKAPSRTSGSTGHSSHGHLHPD